MLPASNAPPPINEVLLHDLEEELHDLCQPLTALNFRLEVGKGAGDHNALREAVDGALEETTRMIDSIKRIRGWVASRRTAIEDLGEQTGLACLPRQHAGAPEING